MEILGWIGARWFELLQATSVLAGLFFAVRTLRMDIKERRIQNLFTVNEAHRSIWSALYERPELARILDEKIDVKEHPPTLEEKRFVHFLILHLRASFKARKYGMEFDDDAIALDISDFFSKPIPRVVWQWTKQFQDADFVQFVDTNSAHTKIENRV